HQAIIPGFSPRLFPHRQHIARKGGSALPATPMKATLHSITPMIPAGASLADELRFYTEHLGFAVVWQTDTMAHIRRDNITFNLPQNDNRIWADNTSFSLGVSDLDALYEEYRSIPAPARIGRLEPKPWGRREFHMIVPSGVCLQFYQT